MRLSLIFSSFAGLAQAVRGPEIQSIVTDMIKEAENDQARGLFNPQSLSRLTRFVKLVEKLLDEHYSEKTAEIWKSRFSNSVHRMLTAYVKCGLGRRDRNRRDTQEDDEELEFRVELRTPLFMNK